MNEQHAKESSEAIEIKKRQRIREIVEEVITQHGIKNLSTEQIVEEVMKRV